MSAPGNLSGLKPNVDEWKLVDAYNSTYWSGQDVNVYIDDIYLEDAIQLNYQILEQVRPYYGYASYTPDRMHHGSRLITGELSVNFKKEGQIFAILQAIRRQESYTVGMMNNSAESQIKNRLHDLDAFDVNDWTAFTDQVGDIDPQTLRQIVDAQKRRQGAVLNSERNRVNINSYESIFQTGPQGFTINVLYGLHLQNAMSLTYINDVGYELSPLPDDPTVIDPYYAEGTVIDNTGRPKAALQTGLSIVGVSLIGMGKSIDDSGKGLVETYSFQARDIRVLNPR